MPEADLSWAKTPDELAAAWSKYIIDELIHRRESGVSSIQAGVFPFGIQDGKVVLPAGEMPIGHPPDPSMATSHLQIYQEGLYAYLVVVTGEPGVPGEWAGPTYTDAQRAEIPIGVPGDLCEKGDYEFYIIASLVCETYPVTWAVRFDGEKFGEIRVVKGTFGGSLIGLMGIGEN